MVSLVDDILDFHHAFPELDEVLSLALWRNVSAARLF